VEKVKNRFGIRIHVINGDQEAMIIYNGIQLAGAATEENALVMDIGGGSTEFIVANDQEITWKNSYELGVSRLLEKFRPSDPMTQEQVEKVEHFLKGEINQVLAMAKQENIRTLIGSSGSFETFCDVMAYRDGNFLDIADKSTLDLNRKKLDALLEELIFSTRLQREGMDGMAAMRINMIVMSSIFVRLVLRNTSIQDVKLSRYALKEGVLFNVLKGNL
jgi:exopolyphosphatase/guanosine-5'-triphosphate,3'-diphosphate pyrophosphatase